MLKVLVHREGSAARCGDECARASACSEHLLSREQCMRNEPDSREGLATIGGDTRTRTPATGRRATAVAVQEAIQRTEQKVRREKVRSLIH